MLIGSGAGFQANATEDSFKLLVFVALVLVNRRSNSIANGLVIIDVAVIGVAVEVPFVVEPIVIEVLDQGGLAYGFGARPSVNNTLACPLPLERESLNVAALMGCSGEAFTVMINWYSLTCPLVVGAATMTLLGPVNEKDAPCPRVVDATVKVFSVRDVVLPQELNAVAAVTSVLNWHPEIEKLIPAAVMDAPLNIWTVCASAGRTEKVAGASISPAIPTVLQTEPTFRSINVPSPYYCKRWL